MSWTNLATTPIRESGDAERGPDSSTTRRASDASPHRAKVGRSVRRADVFVAEVATRYSVRSFGCTLLVGFAVIALLMRATHHVSGSWLALTVGIAVGLPSLAFPGPMRPIRDLWMRGAEYLGRVNSVVLLALLFCLVVVPVGLLSRLLRRDILNSRPNRQAASYWMPKGREQNAMRYFNQY